MLGARIVNSEALKNKQVVEVTKKGPGRPRKHEGLIVRVIDQFFKGDRKAAAEAWGVTREYLDRVISGGALSASLAVEIYRKSEKQVPIEDLVELVPY